MKAFMAAAFLSILTGCAALPSDPLFVQTDRTGSDTFPTGELVFHTIGTSRDPYDEKKKGLVARGLGGLFLPLDVRLTLLSINDDKATVELAVNNISAKCSSGSTDRHSQPLTIRITGVYCNWLAIGNVLASLELVIDSSVEERVYAGRYRMQFFGTGNGRGAGYFIASTVS